ncbi:MAG TPA: metallophosphoesterase, partial [Thermotogales bacterium]|nr:metallophosphoesterase [Thermotogales bacterium]
MKKVISFILIVLLIVSVFSKVIKSDDVGKWATKGVGKDSFTFIIFGDSRPTSPSRPMPDDLLSRILQEISLIHPDFVIHTGDMIVGYTDTLDQAKEEFSSFLKLLYTYAPDVDFLFVPGNHELKPSEEIANLYRKLFG